MKTNLDWMAAPEYRDIDRAKAEERVIARAALMTLVTFVATAVLGLLAIAYAPVMNY